jgi:hypothetical protein
LPKAHRDDSNLDFLHDVKEAMTPEIMGILAGAALVLVLALCARCVVRWMP